MPQHMCIFLLRFGIVVVKFGSCSGYLHVKVEISSDLKKILAARVNERIIYHNASERKAKSSSITKNVHGHSKTMLDSFVLLVEKASNKPLLDDITKFGIHVFELYLFILFTKFS